MGMFDPLYVTEVLNDILGRHGVELVITPKESTETPPDKTKWPKQSE